ncbi:putative carboxypeptidase Y [Aspergillus clavatus NRRL 1]|uniref:Carboxypeptidase Y, putative n=1 Tax=Aspergillus clavatus (strain ATCC 1007 / CBS 513.65 / DSM 816 / NCTC 3887 / NRRL 1 / QM 1276 / 107) TaxID=344612 RepID=A1CKW7_ASPCL|nr:carboxypeptidase Y, putative [Aspergillus clavatus NRRL 1]EAW09791.1 carboxypeptidase Y, putative [Aspergillus clavatus NRRL 1]
MRHWLVGCSLAGLIALAKTAVSPKSIQAPLSGNDDTESFKTFRTPGFPSHSLRIKEQTDEVCDAGSKQYTGWLDFHGKHVFFWYFDSLNDPRTDPLTLWLTGGPGVSSLVGLMLEVGPCRINKGGENTRRNPHSWTRNSSMIFVDQPVGTGLSYVDSQTEVPTSSKIAAEDMYIFLEILMTEVFPERRQNPFHIAGESFAGHYIPTLSREILRQNQVAEAVKIPLQSILIGNGYVSPMDTLYGYYETLCTTKPGVDAPVLNRTRCGIISENLPRCLNIYEVCYQHPEKVVCEATDVVCGVIKELYHNESYAGGRDPFDITRTCEVDHLCYSETLEIQEYINAPSTWAALEVPDSIAKFTIESKEVASAFETANDLYSNVMTDIKYTLDHGVDVLIYNGNLDLACNTAGNLRWAHAFRWSGQAPFTSKDMRSWYATVGGIKVKAGSFKQVSAPISHGDSREVQFAFVTVDRSGHMINLKLPLSFIKDGYSSGRSEYFVPWGLELNAWYR